MSRNTIMTVCPYCGTDVVVCGHTFGYRLLSLFANAWRLLVAFLIIALACGAVICTCCGLYNAAYNTRLTQEMRKAEAIIKEYNSLKAQTHMAELRVRKAKAEQYLMEQKK